MSGELGPFLTALTSYRERATPAEIIGAVAAGLLQRTDLGLSPDHLDPALAGSTTAVDLRDLPWPAAAPSAVLGPAYEVLIDGARRRSGGVFHTPPAIADGVVALARHGHRPGTVVPTVCDPAVGAGAFLLAVARSLLADQLHVATIVGESLFGADVDPLAAAVTRSVLVLWAAEQGSRVPWHRVRDHVVVADVLHDGIPTVAGAPPDGYDLIVGNPPFLNQLTTETARSAATADRVRARFGSAAYRYTDSAALFLLEACHRARAGGRVAFILPESVLGTADAGAARDAILAAGHLRALWWADEPVFAIPVRVCAPVIEVGERPASVDGPATFRVARHVGAGFRPVDPVDPPSDRNWTSLTSGLRGHPVVRIRSRGTIGDLATATAGFRDQFYGVAPHVREAGDHEVPGDDLAALVTSGLIEPGTSRWGARGTRFAGRSWARPVVALAGLRTDAPLWAWTRQRLVPKVVVATQTRVLEAAIDEHGHWFPSVPTISVEPRSPEVDLWELAAAVLAPVASAWAFEHHSGLALSTDAVKLSARQVLDVPLPSDPGRWREAAADLRRAAGAAAEKDWRTAIEAHGAAMNAAHGLGDGEATEVLRWWTARLPTWRRDRSPAGAGARSALTVACAT
jgi:hypothetical protein